MSEHDRNDPTDRFEDDLLYSLTRTGEGFQAEQSALTAGGMARGRRRWRRRSAAAVVSGAAALTLVGAGAFYLTGSPSGQDPAATAVAAAGSGTPATPSAPAPSATAAKPAAMSGEEVLAVFKGMLPQGATVTPGFVRGTDPGGKPYGGGTMAVASVVLDDGKGKAAVGVSLGRYPLNGGPGFTENTCPDKKYVQFDACSSTVLADGSTLTVLQGYEYPDRRVDTKNWHAKLVGKDGRLIELSEWNAAAEKDAPVSRATPPLSPEQLKAIVTDRAWDRVIAAIPDPLPAKPRDTSKEWSKEEITATVTGLLPAGLSPSESGGQWGFADFVVDDGKGKSLVQINVQDWSGDVGDPKAGKVDGGKARLFEGAETLPDGTRVITRKENGTPSMWTVDTLRPDGLRVVISAFNGARQGSAATRTAPALSNEQLRAIVLAPAWKLKK
ncbi:hypothetical protein ACWEQL_26360 [Kitasatospora sp. NPDC004240]